MPWDEVMAKYKAGALRSGGTGPRVRSKKQAIAIMLREKRKADSGDTEYQSKKRGPLRKAAGAK